MPRIRRASLALTLVVALVSLLSTAARAHAASDDTGYDPREVEARRFYAAGEYRRALDLFVLLYAETMHPTYLRNVGRCQQNLGEADKAIASLREYLRKATTLDARGRVEIEGYIREMEDLKRARGAPTPSLAAPAPQASPVAPSLSPMVTRAPAPSAAPLPRWLPWVGVAVTAGLATAAIVTTVSVNSRLDGLHKTCAPPSMPAHCLDSEVDALERQENIRNLFWVLTGATAVATGITFVVSRDPQTRQTELSMKLRF